MRVLIINGSGGSGKDTFVTLCRPNLTSYKVLNLSTIDEVKEIAEDKFGWDLEKDERGRQLLHDLKKAWTKYNGGPARKIFGTVKREALEEKITNKQTVCFIHTREPEEIEKLIDDFAEIGISTKSILVIRDGIEEFSNSSDANVANYNYDFIVKNNGTWEDLTEKAKKFSEMIINWNDEDWGIEI